MDTHPLYQLCLQGLHPENRSNSVLFKVFPPNTDYTLLNNEDDTMLRNELPPTAQETLAQIVQTIVTDEESVSSFTITENNFTLALSSSLEFSEDEQHISKGREELIDTDAMEFQRATVSQVSVYYDYRDIEASEKPDPYINSFVLEYETVDKKDEVEKRTDLGAEVIDRKRISFSELPEHHNFEKLLNKTLPVVYNQQKIDDHAQGDQWHKIQTQINVKYPEDNSNFPKVDQDTYYVRYPDKDYKL
jgi:hypothetical protein